MIIIVIKEPNLENPCAEQISRDYPDCSVFNYKQYTDQELLDAAEGQMLIVLNHKMAIPHAKLLRLAASDRQVRIMVVLEEGFAMHAVNARIAGADYCLAAPYEPAHLLRAVEEQCTILRRLSEAQELVNSQASINRKYTLGAVLGAGRHSVMFLGNVVKTSDTVVIKLFRKSLASSQEFIAELKSKVELLQEVTVPSMVKILDFGNWNGYAYLILNIGKGENLYQVLGKRKLDEHEIAKIALALTRALIAIKKCGILHFNIKPENIIYYQNNFYLSEFGSLLPLPKADSTGFQYWPDSAFTCPETFIDGALFTARSDVYSLGLIVYLMLPVSKNQK
ncbi:MAG: protein kinase [Lentisphaerae bacterium]|nr:protein kinase [Lentisphaerota bacterium]